MDLKASWKRLGVQFTGDIDTDLVDIEVLILKTANAGPADERLFVGAASWLAQYHTFVNGRRLSALVAAAGDETTPLVGVLLSLAIGGIGGAGRAPEFEAALARCIPFDTPRPLYNVMDSISALRQRVQENTLPLYSRWGVWHDDVTLKPESIRPLAWLLNVPEIRARAIFGPSVEADIMARALSGYITTQEIVRETGVSYAAAHAAAERLVMRGMLLRHRNGVRQELSLTEHARPVLQPTENVQ